MKHKPNKNDKWLSWLKEIISNTYGQTKLPKLLERKICVKAETLK